MHRICFTGLAAALAIGLASSAVEANDARCSAPPYGGSVSSYKAFVKNFGHLVVPTKLLGSICNMKFSGSDRTALYNLGFTDDDITNKDTSDLAVDVLAATKNLVDKVK